MCIICCKPKGIAMPSDTYIENMWCHNSDGAGVMYTKNGKVIIDKGYMSLEALKAALKKIAKEVDLTKEAMVLHFRIGTAGGNTPQNTHPFPVMDSIGALKKLKMSVPIGVAHNGIIPVTPRTKDISDTMEYVASQLAPLYRAVPKFYHDKNLMTLVKNAIKSKMAFLIGDGSIYTIGDFEEEEGGLLFSNHTYAYGYVPAYRNSFGYYYGAEDKSWNKYYGWGEDKDALIIMRPLMLLDDGEYMVELDTGEFADTSMGLYFIDENGSCYMYDDAEEACLPLDTFTAFNAQGLSLKFDMSRAEVMEVML